MSRTQLNRRRPRPPGKAPGLPSNLADQPEIRLRLCFSPAHGGRSPDPVNETQMMISPRWGALWT